MSDMLAMTLSVMADSLGAASVMRDYVAPSVQALAALASLACVVFLINGGYLYITSSGKPDALEQAKRVIRNAIVGLLIVLGATVITSLLVGAYGSPAGGASSSLPNLQSIPEKDASNGLIDVLLQAITGLLNTIIQAVAAPFLEALTFFTSSTPLMASNPSVFNLWLAMVGMTDVLFILVLALIGFHVMSAASFGFDEIEFKHLLPRLLLIFLLINTSIFVIDGIIELSNALIAAIGAVSGGSTVWVTLTGVVSESGAQGIAALLLMLAFLVFSVMLLVYYVVRLVTLFIGAVLSPLVLLLWLVPGFRDFSETAVKTYIMTIFTLFVHVVILLLSASLFAGMSAVSGSNVPDTLMAMVVGLATIMALLKTQAIMMQFSYVSMGSRSIRKLGGQFMNGVGYMSSKSSGTLRKLSGHVIQRGQPVSRSVVSRGSAMAPSVNYVKLPSPGVTVSHTTPVGYRSANEIAHSGTAASAMPSLTPATPRSTSIKSKASKEMKK